jgi:Sec-independent protein secretion pathway component TatC
MAAARATANHEPAAERDDESASGRMSSLDHLDELRRRIIRSSVAIGAGMLIAFFFAERIGAFIGPALRALRRNRSGRYPAAVRRTS